MVNAWYDVFMACVWLCSCILLRASVCIVVMVLCVWLVCGFGLMLDGSQLDVDKSVFDETRVIMPDVDPSWIRGISETGEVP